MSVDLRELATQAQWVGGQLVDENNTRNDQKLPFNVGTGHASGYACVEDYEMEDGEPHRVLLTHPMWVSNGTIKGRYPWMRLPENAAFEARVGFIDGAHGTDGVVFQVWVYRVIGEEGTWTRVARVHKEYTESLARIRADLSQFVGQQVTLELRVDAGATSYQDWAAWVNPVISLEQPGLAEAQAGYGEKTVEELREELRDRDLKVSGTKDELVARLEDDDLAPTDVLVEAREATVDYGEKTVEELREELRDRGMKVSGVKDELVARLREADSAAVVGAAEIPVEADPDERTADEGRGELEDRDADGSGDHDGIAARLEEGARVSDVRPKGRVEPDAEIRLPTARQRATDRLIRIIGQHRYPSHQLLDRLEASLRTPQDLEAYSWILSKITESQRYPSLRLLDRLDACALAHEFTAPPQVDDGQAGA